MVKVTARRTRTDLFTAWTEHVLKRIRTCHLCVLVGGGSGSEDSAGNSGRNDPCAAGEHTQRGKHTP